MLNCFSRRSDDDQSGHEEKEPNNTVRSLIISSPPKTSLSNGAHHSTIKTDNFKELKARRQADKKRNKMIGKQLKAEKKRQLDCLKLLLLGTGESGKSTIIKQMKIIHIDGYSHSEKLEFVPNIYRNVRDAIVAITSAMDRLNIEFREKKNRDLMDFLIKYSFQLDYEFNEEFFDAVSKLWQDDGVKACFMRSNEYQLIDSAKYFLDRVNEIRLPGYVPSHQDILRCRKMTDAISEVTFQIKDEKHTRISFKVFDVGGQRGERKKWIQLFDSVTAILFLADCSSFDLTLREDQAKNRLIDALEVFHQTWMNKYLQSVPILVFINKIDILEEKIRAGRRIDPLIDGIFYQYSQFLLKERNNQAQQIDSTPKLSKTVDQLPSNQGRSDNIFCAQLGRRSTTAITLLKRGTSRNIRYLPRAKTTTTSQSSDQNFPTSGDSPSTSPSEPFYSSTISEVNSGNQVISKNSNRTQERQGAGYSAHHRRRVPSYLLEMLETMPFETYQPKTRECHDFISSYPLDAGGLTMRTLKLATKTNLFPTVSALQITNKQQKSPCSGPQNFVRDRNSMSSQPDVHPETVRTACFIKNIFSEMTKMSPIANRLQHRPRKSLFYYTCAVNTDNIQKVLQGCRAFLMEEHLERFGIL